MRCLNTTMGLCYPDSPARCSVMRFDDEVRVLTHHNTTVYVFSTCIRNSTTSCTVVRLNGSCVGQGRHDHVHRSHPVALVEHFAKQSGFGMNAETQARAARVIRAASRRAEGPRLPCSGRSFLIRRAADRTSSPDVYDCRWPRSSVSGPPGEALSIRLGVPPIACAASFQCPGIISVKLR